MKRSSGIQVDLQLIGKYLSGEASPEEALAIDNWRNESAGQEHIFGSAMRLWDLSSGNNTYRQPQTDERWQALKEAVEKTGGKTVLRTASRLHAGWKMAAAFLILIAAAVVLYTLLPHAEPVTFSKVVRSGETTLKHTLMDSSTVSLYRNSRVALSDQYGKRNREVKLDGEAFFSVKPSAGEPFIVYTGGIKIIVLGTAFNVKNSSDRITVSVAEGAVRMQKDASNITVAAGSTGVFFKADNRLEVYTDSLNANAFSYVTREIYFNNASLKEVKASLENIYQIKVMFENKSLADFRINTEFKNKPLPYVLKVIGASLDIQYQLKDDTVFFYERKP